MLTVTLHPLDYYVKGCRLFVQAESDALLEERCVLL